MKKQSGSVPLFREAGKCVNLNQRKFATRLGTAFPKINRWRNDRPVRWSWVLQQMESLLQEMRHEHEVLLRDFMAETIERKA